MALTRQHKADMQAVLTDRFGRATSYVLVDFRGVDVPTDTSLRRLFRASSVDYCVVRNNIAARALAEVSSGLGEKLSGFLKGPTAVAWSYEDPSSAAKVIKAFRKGLEDKEKLVVKCAVLDGQVMAAEAVESQLASLPGKDELRAMLLATMLAPAQSLVRQLAAPGQSVAYVLDGRRRQLEEGS